MSRARSETIPVRATSNVYTALAGAAVVAVSVALLLMWLSWNGLFGGDADAPKLFFNMF
jgi:hypothetical protein